MKCKTIYKAVLTGMFAIFLMHPALAQEQPIMDVGEIDVEEPRPPLRADDPVGHHRNPDSGDGVRRLGRDG